MNDLQIFAFVILPLSIAAGGCIYYYIAVRELDREKGKPPRD